MSRESIYPTVVRYNGKTCIFQLEEDMITCEPQRVIFNHIPLIYFLISRMKQEALIVLTNQKILHLEYFMYFNIILNSCLVKS